MARVVHFEISADNPTVAADFYRNVFNWEINTWDGPQEYLLVSTGAQDAPGINGAIYRPGNGMQGTVNIIDVEDLGSAMEKVQANGGTIISERHTVPHVGYVAYFVDPAGTTFGMIEADTAAGT